MKPILAVLALPIACVALPASAEVPVEAVKIEKTTKFVEIDVAYPKTGITTIDAQMADWTKGMVEDFEKGAAEDFSSFEKDNGEMPPWSYSLDMGFETARNDDAMLVFDFDQSTFLGGAHPSHDIVTYNYLMPDAWEVYLPEIFDGQKALDRISELAIAQLDKTLGGPDGMSDPDWIKTGAGPNWANFQDFLLLEDKLVIRFPPYQVAAYAAGDQKVELPLSELSGLMRKDWKAPVTNFTHWRGQANVIIDRYRSDKSTAPVVIIGHSLGADSSVDMANYLGSRGVPVRLLVTFDGVHAGHKVGKGIAEVINYYKSDGVGKVITAGPSFTGKLTNVDVKDRKGIDHLNIEKSATLHAEVLARLNAVFAK